jgi:hypothetical protein
MTSVDLSVSADITVVENPIISSGRSGLGRSASVFSQANPLSRQKPRGLPQKKNSLAKSGSGKGLSSNPALDQARTLAASALQSSAVRVVDYNRLESVFVKTAMFVLLSGMVFNSTAFAPGGVLYIVMTVIVCGIIICTVIAFVALIVFEVYRAIRYSNLHAVARSMESAAIELRVLNAGKASSEKSASRFPTISDDPSEGFETAGGPPAVVAQAVRPPPPPPVPLPRTLRAPVSPRLTPSNARSVSGSDQARSLSSSSTQHQGSGEGLKLTPHSPAPVSLAAQGAAYRTALMLRPRVKSIIPTDHKQRRPSASRVSFHDPSLP